MNNRQIKYWSRIYDETDKLPEYHRDVSPEEKARISFNEYRRNQYKAKRIEAINKLKENADEQ